MMHSAPDRRLSTITTNQRGFSGNAAGPVQSFISASAISDNTQVSAINTLYTDLVSTNITGTTLWDKIQVLYPFVGGNATSHALNLKDATQYPLTFIGSIIHDSNGVSGTASFNSSFTSTYNMGSLGASDFSFGAYHRSPLSGVDSSLVSLFNTSTASTYLGYRGDGFATNISKFASGTATNVGLTGVSAARFVAVTSNSANTVLSFLNQFPVLSTIPKGASLTGTINASLSTSAGTTRLGISIWYVATAMIETELVALNAIFQKYNDTLDVAFGSTRGTDYYINPNYNRDVNRFVSNIQVPGISTFTTSELNALQYLVNALQNSSTSLWGNLTQIYPFIGNNIAGRLRELKSLGASAATYSGTFNFTPTIGLDPTSTSSYLLPLTGFTWSSVLMYGVYVSEDIANGGYEIGFGTTGATAVRFIVNVKNTSNQLSVQIGAGTTMLVSNTNAIGHYILSSGGSGASFTMYKNGVSIGSGTAGTSNTSGVLNFFAGLASLSSQRTQGITYLFAGLWTTAQITEMNSIIQTYVQMLGR